MGRAGSGSRSGGSRSSSSHRSSSSRSSGHRVSSSRSRAGQGSRSSSSSSFGSSYSSFNFGGGSYHRNSYDYYGRDTGSYNVSYGRKDTSVNIVGNIFAKIIFISCLVFIIAFLATRPLSSMPKSTLQRSKIEGVKAFNSQCITDELSWFNSTSIAGADLKKFYQDTGIQPYIYLKAYDANLVTDKQKEDWANAYFDKNEYADNVLLFVYFAEEDTDNDVGYMYITYGIEAATILDNEAVDILWTYFDKYWYSDISTDELFTQVFNSTSRTSMSVSKTDKDIIFIIGSIVLTTIAVSSIVLIVNTIAKKKKEADERAKEILNAPIGDMIDRRKE